MVLYTLVAWKLRVVHLHPEGVRGVVDDLEAVLVGYLLYPPGVARLAVAVHRHDGRGPGGDGRLYAVGVDAAVRRVDVHEHGLDAVPPEGVGGGHEAPLVKRLMKGTLRYSHRAASSSLW